MSNNISYKVKDILDDGYLLLENYLVLTHPNDVVKSTEDRSWAAKNEGRHFPDTRVPNRILKLTGE